MDIITAATILHYSAIKTSGRNQVPAIAAFFDFASRCHSGRYLYRAVLGNNKCYLYVNVNQMSVSMALGVVLEVPGGSWYLTRSSFKKGYALPLAGLRRSDSLLLTNQPVELHVHLIEL